MFEASGLSSRSPSVYPALLEAIEPEAVRPVDPEVRRVAWAQPFTERAEWQPKASGPKIERLVGIDAIRERIRILARSCIREVCSFIPGGVQSAASLLFTQAVDIGATNRGVQLRAVCLDSVRSDPVTRKYAEWMIDIGSEVRTAPALPLRMLIVDRQTAVVPVDTAGGGAVELVISGTGIVTALVALFNAVWMEALPFASARCRTDEDLSAQMRDESLSTQERQVLTLLAEGHTDEAIARRLSISLRTTRRVAARLLARLGARSRFQAGALAVARNWLQMADFD